MATVFRNGSMKRHPDYKNYLKAYGKVLTLASKFPKSQSDWGSVRFAGKTSQIYGGPTLQPIQFMCNLTLHIFYNDELQHPL